MEIEAVITDVSHEGDAASRTQARAWADRLCFGMLLLTVFTIPFDDIIVATSRQSPIHWLLVERAD